MAISARTRLAQNSWHGDKPMTGSYFQHITYYEVEEFKTVCQNARLFHLTYDIFKDSPSYNNKYIEHSVSGHKPTNRRRQNNSLSSTGLIALIEPRRR